MRIARFSKSHNSLYLLVALKYNLVSEEIIFKKKKIVEDRDIALPVIIGVMREEENDCLHR